MFYIPIKGYGLGRIYGSAAGLPDDPASSAPFGYLWGALLGDLENSGNFQDFLENPRVFGNPRIRKFLEFSGKGSVV